MRASTQRLRILNVDDNEIGRYTKSRILKQAGFEVIEAVNGADALQAVRDQRPGLVLLDLQLPDVNGFEVCRRIKGDPLTARIPVLHITAATSPGRGTELNSAASGADIFLAQPVEPQELITVVKTLIKLRTTELGLAESEERMRLATEGAGIATWEINLRDGSAFWSPQLFRMLGYDDTGTEAHWSMWKSVIHPEDIGAVVEAMERAQRDHGVFTHEHRIIRNGTRHERWLSAHGRIHPDERGHYTRLLGIVVDVTARRSVDARREELLRLEHAARNDAEKVAHMKDEFLATLSHELRSPMSAILGWLKLMRTGRLTADQHDKAIDTIERNALLQSQLINDLLDVSRVIAGKLDLYRVPVLIADVIAEAVNSVRIAADAKEIEIESKLEPIGPLHYDAGRLQQIFVNILGNAIKFTPRGGRIIVQSNRRNEWYDVDIIDNGEGVAPDLLPMLFERFMQADGSSTRRHGGLGLGLAIVRHLVELHGGKVAAKSDGPGKGTTISVCLPIATDPALLRPTMTKLPPEVASQSPNALDGIRILMVDDDASIRDMMSEVLESHGAVVSVAGNGRDAMDAWRRATPDVLMLDIGMPGEDGYTLLKRLRAAFPDVFVPAIAVTGFALDSDREQAREAGFDQHMTKPFDIDAIIQTAARLAADRPVRQRQPGYSIGAADAAAG
jgi:PAS domain S-box-containing protein